MSHAACGTPSGYNRHRRLGEAACPACLEAVRVRNAKWRAANPEKRRVNSHRGRLKAKYNLTPDEVEAMRAVNDGVCPICNRRPATHIDHNHITGAPRQLLCGHCNSVLGFADDDPEVLRAAATYLEHHK